MALRPVIPESLYDIVNVEDPQLSPDGQTVAFVHMTQDGNANAYRRAIWLAAADGSTPPRPFTAGSAQDYHPRWSPDGQTLLFLSTRGGTPQIHVIPAAGGEAKRLTDLFGGVANPAWSPDGQRIAFTARTTAAERALEDQGVAHDPNLKPEMTAWQETHRARLKDPRVITKLPYRTGTDFFDGRYAHVYVISADGGAPKRLTDGDWHHSQPSWTTDSRQIITVSNRLQSTGDEFYELWATIFSYDVETGAEKVLGVEVSEGGSPTRVSPDGRWLAYTTVAKVYNPYADGYQVAIMPLAGGEGINLTKPQDLTVAEWHWDVDSQALICLVHEKGDAKLMRLPIDGSAPQTLVDGPRWVQGFSVGKDGKRIAFSLQSPTMPSDLFVVERPSGQEHRLTDLNAEWCQTHFLSEPEEIWYKGEGGLDIQGWYMRPKGFDPQKRWPLVVEIHGGPSIMWGNSFWHEFQVLTSRGYFVFYCNPRGSAGYGRQFVKDRGKGGYTDAPDIMKGLQEVLDREPTVDPERLAVTGGSYGGFLTGWIVTHYHEFKAAVSQRGVYDELNMFGSGDIPESVEWVHEGLPRVETLQDLWEYSPVAHAENVTTPLLILHSEQDYRVPISQAESFFAHLRRRGKREVTMVRFPSEGHELSRSGQPNHRVARLYKIINWFEKYIRPEQLQPPALGDAALAEALAALPGWQRHGNALSRTIPCGTFGAAVLLLNRVAKLAEEAEHHPICTVQGSELILRLTSFYAKGITEKDIHLARNLNQRVFRHPKA
ncbi:MAG: prolyl oligopeptidase family serine peptidase [Chloroflexi bacterium]|nr:prolyl oligopeptidase family serine peptidase [Chloroflexota bacterium]